MAIRKRYSNFVCGIEVSGVIMALPESGDPLGFVCQVCLVDTNKTVVGEVIQFGMIEDDHHACVECEKCKTHYVVGYKLEHGNYGYIETDTPITGLSSKE